jgi:hypothetical protein
MDDIDVGLPPGEFLVQFIEALVTDPDEEPLNDVEVTFRLPFGGASEGTIPIDVNEDGIPDEVHILQLVRPGFEGIPRTEWDLDEDGDLDEALIDSPFEIETIPRDCQSTNTI